MSLSAPSNGLVLVRGSRCSYSSLADVVSPQEEQKEKNRKTEKQKNRKMNAISGAPTCAQLVPRF
jgi:hypothetical protein